MIRRIAVVSDSRAFASAGNARRDPDDPGLFPNVLAELLGVDGDGQRPSVALLARPAGSLAWATLDLRATTLGRQSVAAADLVVLHVGIVDSMPWLGGGLVQARLRMLRRPAAGKRMLGRHITLMRWFNRVTRGLVPNTTDRAYGQRLDQLCSLVRRLNPDAMVVLTGSGHVGRLDGARFGLMMDDSARPAMARRVARRADLHRAAAAAHGAVLVEVGAHEAELMAGTDGIHYGDDLHRAVGHALAQAVIAEVDRQAGLRGA